MFELLNFVFAALLLASIAGVIYPFSPFNRRSRALVSLFFAFVAVIAVQGVKESRDGTPAGSVGDLANEREAPAGPQSEEDLTAADGSTDSPKPLPEERRNEVLATVEASDWTSARTLALAASREGYDIRQLRSDVEAAALAVVRPLPASRYQENALGYAFLAWLVPQNDEYHQKATDYERRHTDAIERENARLVNKFQRKFDKVENITWYHLYSDMRMTS